jgi:hypothetical protein
VAVDGGVAGELGVEGGGKDVALLDERGLALMLGEDSDAGGDFFDDRAANEYHFEWIFLEGAGTEEDVAGQLAAVAIAKNGHVEEFEGILCGIFHVRGKEDGASTSAKDGAAIGGEIANGVIESLFLEELELGCAFAAGKDEAVAVLKVGDGADLDGVRSELVEHSGVRLEITLNGENADFHGSGSRIS